MEEGLIGTDGHFTERPMTPPQEDRHLAALTFEAFYDEWFPRGVGYAMRVHFLNRHDAEDAVVDAMANVQAAWGGIDNPAGYFRVILHRRSIDTLRTVIRREQHETSVPDAELAGEETLPADLRAAFVTLHDPESMYVRSEQSSQILAALSQLPLSQRISLVLEAEGYSAQERAKVKDVSESTERSHLNRARTRIRRLLLDQGLPRQKPSGEPETKNTDEKEGEGK
ncbi:RNA polymerase sigma factor [Streptomyces mirabilis]